MRARTGKIARLPHAIREQINLRLRDGQQGNAILHSLNSSPEVQALLATEFGGRPLTHCNLSEWRRGGFHDWQIQQESLDLVRALACQKQSEDPSSANTLPAQVARLIALRFAASAQLLDASDPDPKSKWFRLRVLSNDIIRLRHADLRSANIALRLDRAAFEQTKIEPPGLDSGLTASSPVQPGQA